ncbi:hypothetical protein IQ22_00412 [Pseudomonas duriflava]|uniref:Uncharacterized protein n=1 Tax=Pseudomonas duriflava TaxID=459528 RepID=A0A562QPM4_9PSED|nr:hypothetical protein [Pseudomonas duriflava]TWI58702.1 hypothetical protein IQ22_00412 [Pseudomonas duriflava]
MKKRPVLSMEMVRRTGSLVNMTPGHALVYRFCTDVENGVQPSDEDMKAIAFALRGAMTGANMSESMDEVGRRLGLAKKQGKQLSEQSQWFEKSSRVAQYMLETIVAIEAGANPKLAESEVKRRHAAALNIGDRAMRNLINKHKDTAKLMLRATYGIEPPAGLWK